MGRAASEAALILRGKNSASFEPNVVPKNRVKIINVTEAKFTGNKTKNKTYEKYSGYPGGLKTLTLKEFFKKNPQECFRKAVERMLPKNKLRKQLIKNLTFE